jgi:hypothetical protein
MYKNMRPSFGRGDVDWNKKSREEATPGKYEIKSPSKIPKE